MCVEPITAIGRGGHHADRLVFLLEDLIGFAVFPRRQTRRARPCVGVTGAANANEHGGGCMCMRLGILSREIFADELIKDIARHVGLHALVAGRASVIEIELGVKNIGNEIGLAHGETAQRIGDDVVLGLEVGVAAVKA